MNSKSWGNAYAFYRVLGFWQVCYRYPSFGSVKDWWNLSSRKLFLSCQCLLLFLMVDHLIKHMQKNLLISSIIDSMGSRTIPEKPVPNMPSTIMSASRIANRSFSLALESHMIVQVDQFFSNDKGKCGNYNKDMINKK